MKTLQNRLEHLKKQPFYKNLSFGMKLKMEEVIKRDHERGKADRLSNISMVAFGLPTIYVFLSINSYTNKFQAYLTSRAPMSLGFVETWMLIIALVSGAMIYFYSNHVKKINESFQALRKTLMSNYEKDFCNCKPNCDCKEKSIEYFNKEQKINLSF